MKKKLYLLLMILFISGCAVVKTPTISGVDQDNGQIKMSYNYGLFERPDVKWNETLDSASAQCKNWGYIDAQQSTGPQTNCIKEDQKGSCISWQVDSLYKCNLSAEQQAVLNEKREKEYIKQQEETKKTQLEEQQRKVAFSKEFPYTAHFFCGSRDDVNDNIAVCFIGSQGGISTNIEINNGQDYGLYQAREFGKLGKATREEGLVIPLRSKFHIQAQMTNNDYWKLTLVIKKTDTGEVTYKKSATRYGWINVSK